MVCGIPLCSNCAIEDRGGSYCDSCYAERDADQDAGDPDRAGEMADSEDYIDLEMMDLMDTDEDDGLF
jgi:hypothetical protein